MTKVAYEYFGPQGQRRSTVKDMKTAEREIGSRVIGGFREITLYPTDRDGHRLIVLAFLNHRGQVWALYVID